MDSKKKEGYKPQIKEFPCNCCHYFSVLISSIPPFMVLVFILRMLVNLFLSSVFHALKDCSQQYELPDIHNSFLEKLNNFIYLWILPHKPTGVSRQRPLPTSDFCAMCK